MPDAQALQVKVDGETLHVSVHRAHPARGTLVLVHGFLSEGGEFAATATDLAARGWNVAVPDLRGHGKSTGPRGYASARIAAADLRATFDALRSSGLAGPFGIIGHSTGAALVAHYLGQSMDAKAAVLVAPLNRLLDEVGAVERAAYIAAGRASKLAARAGFGHLKVPYKYATKSGYRKLFDDRAAADRAAKQGFLQTKADLAWYDDMVAIEGAAWARDVKQPTLVVLCTRDRVLKNANSMKVYDGLAGEKKLVKVETGHSAFGDSRRDEVVAEIDRWFGEKLARAA